MTEELQPAPPPEGFDEYRTEAAEEEARQSRFPRQLLRRIGNGLARAWSRVIFTVRWLRRPDEVGKPITLPPRSVRLLVLLILANGGILLLVILMLYRALTLTAVDTPVPPTPATATPDPSPTPSPSPTPLSSGGAIAFTLRRNHNTDIYAFNQTDRQIVRLTHDPAEDRDPTWSPGGDQVAFASNRADNWDIYLLDLTSGALIRLTRDPGFDGNPIWSPDGETIAFESYRNGNLDIYTMKPDGRQVRRITVDPAPDSEPAWSPDGRGIIYTSLHEDKEIYLRLLDGSGRTINITNSPGIDESHPTWSPDGTHLAYVSGPRSNSSVQITTFDWDTLSINQGQTELFGSGASPTWAPDGQSFVYIYERGGQNHLITASTTGWGLFQEIYAIDQPIDHLAWTSLDLSQRVIARAQADDPGYPPSPNVELVQPTPASGPPYRLVPLVGVDIQTEEAGFLSDRINDSFNTLRTRVIEEAGWDYLATLGSAWIPMTYTPPSGHSRMNWHICGRAIGLDQAPYESEERWIELAREDVGSAMYWRVFLRAAEQDGSMGEPLREAVWDLNARYTDEGASVEGGIRESRIPVGYYIDLTTLADDYGWERLPALWRWRTFWPDVRWWEFQKTDGLTWWACMLEVFEPQQIEAAFGPIPGIED